MMEQLDITPVVIFRRVPYRETCDRRHTVLDIGTFHNKRIAAVYGISLRICIPILIQGNYRSEYPFIAPAGIKRKRVVNYLRRSRDIVLAGLQGVIAKAGRITVSGINLSVQSYGC